MSTPTSSPARGPRLALAAGCAALTLALASACSTGDDSSVEPPGSDGAERALIFEGGGREVSATLTLPLRARGPLPGALIISGSGPTDRDGNSPLRPEAETSWNLARVLAEAGVASLRYDKLGSGESAAELDSEAPVDPQVFDDEVAAAYEELVSQPEIDPERTVVVGHSEGALYALRAHDIVDAEPARMLVAPPGTRYLDLIDRQITEQARQAEATGQLPEGQAVELLSAARYGRAEVRAGRELDDDTDSFGVYTPQNQDFLAWIDSFDPVDLAADLPADTPVLVLWGEQDAQVAGEEVDRLMTGLPDATRVDLPGADHILREFRDEPGATVLDSDRPFSADVAPAVTEFLDTAW
ncbi:S9 family peptidase [Nocardiopsis sp. Huas11]|uniref:alpha/beta hydrolase family protein n=1 Tax=Nocardiopsis sp. Huas11 TaxID=2183912 RepID=UPI000EB204CA|nr:alpha/beta fold hydrolase [Nocardiopsis sp. Huas11]